MKKKQVQALLAGMAAMMAVILPTSSVWAAVPAKRTNHINLRIHSNPKGGCKKTKGRHHNRADAALQSNTDRFFLSFSTSPLLLISAGH